MSRSEQEIFEQGSQTYYNASRFFSKAVRDDVFKFYSFVRVIDDLVDVVPPKKQEFKNVVKAYKNREVLNGEVGQVLKNIYYIEDTYKLDPTYMQAFLASMDADLHKKTYKSIDELVQDYIYGSAEVIGIVMCKIIGVEDEGLHYGAILGRSMQYINFIRDIDEDNSFGRTYIPESELKKFGLKNLSHKEVLSHKEMFTELIRAQIETYEAWVSEAEKGYKYLPYRSRIAIKTASDMYKWTAHTIYKNPLIVFEKKVKPSRVRLIRRLLWNAVTMLGG